ncbi:hypothetical protein FRC02_011151 [Tulasnella sp. 418]|nr:hypothetical protein FRC02_011151 [Tulasnella sp. 418]
MTGATYKLHDIGQCFMSIKQYFPPTFVPVSILMELSSPQGNESNDLDSRSEGNSVTASSEWTSGQASERQGSSIYEADFSTYTPSVNWPRRELEPPGHESLVPSVYSFHESPDGHLFRNYNGRICNAKNVAYLLPADEEERRRLDIQHTMVQKYFGAPYPAKEAVEQILKPRDGYKPMILDVGAGSGAWYTKLEQISNSSADCYNVTGRSI